MKQFVLGIDPGKNGGIVGLTNGHINLIDKMPQTPAEMWGYFNTSGLRLILKSKDNIYVFIEDVHSMPTDGVRSAFTFGRQLGYLDMVLASCGVDPIRVVPSVWMGKMGLKRQGDETRYNYKKRLVQEAKLLAPNAYDKKITLQTADAFLIAKYGQGVLNDKEITNTNNKKA